MAGSLVLLSHLEHQVYYNCFEDLNFVDDKLPMKTARFTSLKNLYVYSSTLANQC